MIDRADAEAVLYRAAFTAVSFGGSASRAHIDEDVDWCLQPLAGLNGPDREHLEALVTALVQDPTTHRDALNETLARMVD